MLFSSGDGPVWWYRSVELRGCGEEKCAWLNDRSDDQDTGLVLVPW
jgi:hypothetical protein